jgi:hypothetical protein
MTRRVFAPLLLAPAAMMLASSRSVRGKLRNKPGLPPLLELSDGQSVLLSGDEPTIGVLRDFRLKDADFEALGAHRGPATFEIDPIHTRSLFVHREGKRLMVTYWCDICYIRTYTPGECWCCQEYTALDLRDPDAPERVP